MTDHDPRPRPRPEGPPPPTPGEEPTVTPARGSRLEMPPSPPAVPSPAASQPAGPPPPAAGGGGRPSEPPARTLSRRRLLGVAGGVAGAAAVGGGLWATLLRDRVEDSGAGGVAATTSTTAPPSTTTTLVDAAPGVPVDERVLVIVELDGGNDALNTLVTSDGRYRTWRPTLALPEDELVALGGVDFGLHPALAALQPYWDDASMAAVAGVGMPEQTRSHFTAMDTWWSATPGAASQTGWLGRWLDATLDGEPDPLRAIALGGGSRALVGLQSLATVIRSPETFALRTMPGADTNAIVDAFLATAAPLSSVPELAAAQSAIPSTLEAVELLASVGAVDPTGDGAAIYDDQGIGTLLQTVAGIIDLGIGTRVFTVAANGFDTHADQLDRQAALLQDVGDGIAGFLARLEADGHRDRVMVVTTSEFGRRAAENGSGGTDHGTGGCGFLFGPTVHGGQVVGGYDLDNLVQGDLPVLVDTRSVYSAALDWLGGPTDELLDGPHDRLGLISA